MRTRTKLLAGAFTASSTLSGFAWAQTSPATPDTTIDSKQVQLQPTTMPAASPSPTVPVTAPSASDASNLGTVTVTADLDRDRDQIAPSLGAQTYTIGPSQIASTPRGENAPFQQILLRAPGVAVDSFGQEHVRGDHGNLTYRVNGVILPEPLNGFGQELDTHLIQSVTLIDGTLPAQFGFKTAGVVDVTTKSGANLQGGSISVYGGSYGTLITSAEAGGTSGNWDYFVTATSLRDEFGIEGTTNAMRQIHDVTQQERLFTYMSYRLDDTSRVSLLLNASNGDFQLPNTKGLSPAFTLAGVPTANSSDVNETQNEQEYYAVGSFQKTYGNLTYQVSAFSRYGQLNFGADHDRDLIFQGVSADVYNSFITNGVQADASLVANDHHTIRFGLLADYTQEYLDSHTSVFATDAAGDQTSNTPFTISDDGGNYATEAGVYIQDEWSLTPKLTLNYGARFDTFHSNFDTENQISPRVNLVYRPDDKTTFHIGYARYFVPPPIQNVTLAQVNAFNNTTNAAAILQADGPKVERSDYYDVGVSRQVFEPLTLGVDAYYKEARNLNDLGQFGNAIILSPFNYHRAHIYGAELSATYTQDGFSAFGNFGWVLTGAKDINSQQFEFDPDEFSYIADHDIKLDHESETVGSAGVSYTYKDDSVYADMTYESGLRSGFANTEKLKPNYPLNVGYQHVFHVGSTGKDAIKLRFDCVNVADQVYAIRDGGGLGVAAAQYGQRRSFFVGLAYEF